MRARKHAFAKYLVVILTLLWSAALVSGPIWAAAAPTAQPAMVSSLSKAQVAEGYGRLPLFFMENQGQTDSQVKFYSQGKGHAIFFTPAGMVLSLSRTSDEVNRKPGKGKDGRVVVQLRPQGMRSGVEILATDSLPGKVNYFKGSDPGNWRTDVPTYKSVLYREAYKGIDLKFYGAGQHLEYDLVVKPGADPKQAKFLFQGVKALKVTKEGDLSITLPDGGKLVQQKPVIYQDINGQRISREGKFRILPGTKNRGYGFELASYDARYPLIIDPLTLSYSTYLGGSTWESGNAIAVDTAGSAYVVGTTQSPDFITAASTPPPPAGFQATFGGVPEDAFVAKFNVAGNALVYATFLGGNGDDIGLGIAVDVAGNAYVTGETESTNFPVTLANAKQTALAGVSNAFVTKLGSTGALLYSTYLGGSGSDLGVSCAVDNAGNAYVAGNTTSADFPTAGAHVQVTLNGSQNAFVAMINPNAATGPASLPYSTFLGGSTSEIAWGVAVDPAGAFIYVAGTTASVDFPKSAAPNPLPFQSTLKGPANAFVTKINPAPLAGQSGLVYSTYLGGTGIDSGSGGVAADAAGNMYVAGDTSSVDFPVSLGAFQTALAGISNAFVTKINSTVSGAAGLVYSTYLGGNDADTAWWLTVDPSGSAYVTGDTSSTNFPVVSTNTFQASLTGSSNAFVTKLNPQGTALIFSTYLGGTNADVGFGIALDTNLRMYVTGVTSSTDFPVKGAIKSTLSALGSSAFVTKLLTYNLEPMLIMLELL